MLEPRKPPFARHEGLFELGGTTWIWASTCSRPRCPCRSALVVATNEGHDVLLERTVRVRGAQNQGAEYAKLASELGDVVALGVDIDTGVALVVKDGRPSDVVEHAGIIGGIVDLLDGDLLDALGHLWLRGKERLVTFPCTVKWIIPIRVSK